MNRPSLVTRLSLALALMTFMAAGAIGFLLYDRLVAQLSVRDDIALITRIDQIRTLLRDEDAIELFNTKPQLFANMLGNQEAMLVVKYPGQKPLIEINPARTRVPELVPVAAQEALSLRDVTHAQTAGMTPFIVTSALAKTTDPDRELVVISGRVMAERTRMLNEYRYQVIFGAAGAGLAGALLVYLLARRALAPIGHLAKQTGEIGMRSLNSRIDTEQAPEELVPLIDSFNCMLGRLETGFAQLSQVSADMAHDLRTPVNNMLGQIEVALGHHRSTEYYEKVLGSTFEELQRLSRMTDSMLFLARAEHADHAIERRTLDLHEELERVCEYFEGPASDREVRVVCEGEGSVWADRHLLRRALGNLLSNAVRYADKGSDILLRAVQAEEGTTFTVENHGPTIPKEHLERIFDRFYRVDASRTGSSSSSGLGLSIVRSVMQLHQGRWSASSADGLTRFTLFFPDVTSL